MTNTAFHEAAHAVAAVALGMSDVRAYIGRGESETGISINGETVYLFPLIREETPEAMLQRRVTVTFAGPAWETHSDPKFRPRSFHLRAQKVDCLKARELIRRARRECGLRGAALAAWLEESWEDAAGMIESEIGVILAVAEALDQLKTLDDAAIRVLIQDAGGGFPALGCPQSPGAGPAAKMRSGRKGRHQRPVPLARHRVVLERMRSRVVRAWAIGAARRPSDRG